jgi:hypothetical protein
MEPPFRCRCGSEFALSREETIEVTRYAAGYRGSWVPGGSGLSLADLEHMCLSRARQHAIRQIETERPRGSIPPGVSGQGPRPGR